MTGEHSLIAAISAHVERCIGKIAFVIHEIESDAVHIDVHYVPARKARSFDLLVTSGMSQRPMTTPPEASEWRHAELVALLPPGWPLHSAAHAWPVHMLRDLAHFPHRSKTWLGCGHTIADAEHPPRPYAPGTRLTSVFLHHSPMLPERFTSMQGPDGKKISFLTVVPLYEQELQVKLRYGTAALLARLAARGINDIIDPKRQSAVIEVGDGDGPPDGGARARRGGPWRLPDSIH